MRERSEMGKRPLMRPGDLEVRHLNASRPEAAKSMDVDRARERYQRALLESIGE